MIKVGVKVRLKHTGDIAIVKESVGNGYYNVLLEKDNYSIPVTDSDIELLSFESKPVPKSNISYSKSTSIERFVKSIFSITDSGLFLILVPEYDNALSLLHYKVGVFNDLNKKVTFNLNIETKENYGKNYSDLVQPYQILLVGELPYDLFNMAPQFIFTLWESTTEGNINCRSNRIKPKPKSLTKNSSQIFEFEIPVYLFEVIRSFKVKNSERGTGEDLATYTQKAIAEKVDNTKVEFYEYDIHNVWDIAEFPREIDLHIEKLEPEFYLRMNKGEIVKTQLKAFDEYLEKAILLGVEKVFVIHGIGTSRLKNMVSAKLALNKNIESFNNNMHPKYGAGATEIIIGK